MFYRSLSPIEQAHIVEAFTFELGKVYEQAIKERELQVLANVDADLCAQVAAGLGLPAPKGKPAEDVTVSPALSQIVAEPGPDRRPQGRRHRRRRLRPRRHRQAACKPPDGARRHRAGDRAGRRGARRRAAARSTVDRTLLTARSIEFDALVVAGGTTPTGDIKLVVLLQEAFRHCKAIAAWGDGAAVLKAARISGKDPGVAVAEDVDKAFTANLAAALGLHRAWDRAAKVMASAVPPAA